MPHQRVSDLEHSSPLPPLDRFPSLASFIASDPDHTLLVFKRFDKLAARNLLYLQSELIALQAQQDLFDAEDQSLENDDRQAKQCAMDWESFKTASSDPRNEKQKVRMKLMLEIRHKLKEYREALQFESSLATLKAPPPRTFDAIKKASTRLNRTANRIDSVFSGHSAELYNCNDDLVMLKPPEHDDRITAFVQRYLPVFFASGRRDDGMAYIPEKRLANFVTVVSVLMAVVLMFVAIVTLYFVASPKKKLIIVGAYMLLFAGSVGLFTTARRSEVFAATAAYAAVLVVFVSGNLGVKP